MDITQELLNSCLSYNGVMKRLGLNRSGYNLNLVKSEILKLGLVFYPKNKSKRTKEEIQEAINTSYSWNGALDKLNLRKTGGNQSSIRYWASLYDIDTSHFNISEIHKQIHKQKAKERLPSLGKDKEYKYKSTLKYRLVKAGLKKWNVKFVV